MWTNALLVVVFAGAVCLGEVTERPIVQHWKCCVPVTVPRVRIPPSPPLEVCCVFLRLARYAEGFEK